MEGLLNQLVLEHLQLAPLQWGEYGPSRRVQPPLAGVLRSPWAPWGGGLTTPCGCLTRAQHLRSVLSARTCERAQGPPDRCGVHVGPSVPGAVKSAVLGGLCSCADGRVFCRCVWTSSVGLAGGTRRVSSFLSPHGGALTASHEVGVHVSAGTPPAPHGAQPGPWLWCPGMLAPSVPL